MTEKPSPEDEKRDEAEFQRVLGNLVNTPPKPHPAPTPGRTRGRPAKAPQHREKPKQGDES